MRTATSRLCVLAVALLLAHGCGGSGTIVEDSAASADAYVVLDLASGTFSGAGNDVDATADVRYRTSSILFRRIPGGTSRLGTEGNLSPTQEQVLTTVSYDEYFVSVFEVSQEQWRRLAGTEPWASPIHATAFGATAGPALDGMPAYGMSFEQARQAASGWSRDGWTVDLPTATEWEVACRAGVTNKLFPWGASSTAQNNQAVFRETDAASAAPHVVGVGRTPNAWGLYDMIGNVWEYTVPASGTDGALRGGAFDQPLLVCRVSHAVTVPADLGLPTAGVRLTLRRIGR